MKGDENMRRVDKLIWGEKQEEKKERRNKTVKASAWGTSLGCVRQEALEKRRAVILHIAVNSCSLWMAPRAQVEF